MDVFVAMEKELLSYDEAIRRASDALHRFPLIDVQGVPLMSTIADSWQSISEFCPDPSDLLISTYPKAGKNNNNNNKKLANHPKVKCFLICTYFITRLHCILCTLHSLS